MVIKTIGVPCSHPPRTVQRTPSHHGSIAYHLHQKQRCFHTASHRTCVISCRLVTCITCAPSVWRSLPPSTQLKVSSSAGRAVPSQATRRSGSSHFADAELRPQSTSLPPRPKDVRDAGGSLVDRKRRRVHSRMAGQRVVDTVAGDPRAERDLDTSTSVSPASLNLRCSRTVGVAMCMQGINSSTDYGPDWNHDWDLGSVASK